MAYRRVPIPDAESGLRCWQERSTIRYDTTPAWHEYIRETAVASRKEANGRPADQPQIRLERWLLAISCAGHAQRVRREKSVIPTPCYHSRQWLVDPAKAPFRGYQILSLVTQIYTYNRRNWPRRRARNSRESLWMLHTWYLHLDFSVTWRRVGRGNDCCESIKVAWNGSFANSFDRCWSLNGTSECIWRKREGKTKVWEENRKEKIFF